VWHIERRSVPAWARARALRAVHRRGELELREAARCVDGLVDEGEVGGARAEVGRVEVGF